MGREVDNADGSVVEGGKMVNDKQNMRAPSIEGLKDGAIVNFHAIFHSLIILAERKAVG